MSGVFVTAFSLAHLHFDYSQNQGTEFLTFKLGQAALLAHTENFRREPGEEVYYFSHCGDDIHHKSNLVKGRSVWARGLRIQTIMARKTWLRRAEVANHTCLPSEP